MSVLVAQRRSSAARTYNLDLNRPTRQLTRMHGPARPLRPKPTHGAACLRCGLSGLGTAVRQRPLASTVVGGDCYSLGYSVPREWGSYMGRCVRLRAGTIRLTVAAKDARAVRLTIGPSGSVSEEV
jgi:hypothetical protein